MNLDRDSVPEFVTADWVFAYWQTSFAFSASPRIVLRYRDGRYRLAPDLMRKAPPSDGEIDRAAEPMCRKTAWDDTDFGSFTKYFADLLYAGNSAKAQRYLQHALCGDKAAQQDFLKEFSQQIKKSRYWPELSALTGDLTQ